MKTKKILQPLGLKMRLLQWSLLLIIGILPIVLLSMYSFRIASESVLNLIHAEDLSKTDNIALLVQQDLGKTVSLAEAFAEAPGTINALRDNDSFILVTRLKALTLAFPALRSALLTDPYGQNIAVYPATSSKQDNEADVIQKVVLNKKPNISGIYHQVSGSGGVVSVAAPIIMSGSVHYVVILRYGTEVMNKWLSATNLPSESSLFIVDQEGRTVARSGIESSNVLNQLEYSNSPEIQKALNGILHTSEYIDPNEGKMVGTFLPVAVGKNTWVVIAQKPKILAYKDLDRVGTNIALAGVFLTLVTLFMVIMLARTHRKNMRLNEELYEKNVKLSESSAIVETSNDAIIGFMRDGKIRTWNKAAEKIFGWKTNEIIGNSVAMIIPKNKQDEFASLLTKVISGETIQNFETIRMQKNGGLIPVSVTLSPIRDEDRNIIAVSSIDRDITELKRIDEMKDDFISFVSHQLKAPITAIRWTLESLTDGDYGKIPEAIQKPLEEIRAVNVQNFHLVNDILNASRIDRGVIAVEIKSIPLNDIVKRALRDYEIAIKKAGLTLTVMNSPTLLTVSADIEKAAESITNSISNALKHTKIGGITIKVYQKDTSGYIDVSDTGEGMSKDVLDKLFTRSGIIGNNTVAEKSAGLGLYIAKHFMEIQGGSMLITSEEGKGTTCTYQLPLARIVD